MASISQPMSAPWIAHVCMLPKNSQRAGHWTDWVGTKRVSALMQQFSCYSLTCEYFYFVDLNRFQLGVSSSRLFIHNHELAGCLCQRVRENTKPAIDLHIFRNPIVWNYSIHFFIPGFVICRRHAFLRVLLQWQRLPNIHSTRRTRSLLRRIPIHSRASTRTSKRDNILCLL